MSNQDPRKRIENFDSVALGLSEIQAKDEAKRCLQCKKPQCAEGCPVNIDIPRFINHIKKGRFQHAIDAIKKKNKLKK